MSIGQANGKSEVASGIRKRMLQVVLTIVVSAAILFISSGRLDWVMAWVYIGVGLGIVTANALIIIPRNPEMIAERAQVKEGTKEWDRVLASLGAGLGLLPLVVAGLDKRFGWVLGLPLAVQLLALACFVLGNGLWSWSMFSNKFFSGTVRIQKERGHTVVTTGAYRFVRHPGYLGFIIFSIATPLLLGSLWALIPAGLTATVVIIRTALEDQTLLDELNGYKEYTSQVRYRLLPGVW